MIRRLFIVVLAAAAAYAVLRWGPRYNYRRFSADVAVAVNHELFTDGIFDHQMVSRLNREQSRWGIVWIQSERRIQIERPEQFSAVVNGMRRLARKRFCQFSKEPVGNDVLLQIYQGPFILQKLTVLGIAPKGVEQTAVAPLAIPVSEPVVNGPRVAIVIDDVAYSLSAMDHFAQLNVPLTFAILPRDRRTKELAEKATRLHFPVILHLPMEPVDLLHNNPGNAGLYLKMSPSELHEQFEKDVASVPYIQGINNHMGSAFTENTEKMTLVMRWVKEKGLFFLDSRTSLHSVVPAVARKAGVPCHVNSTFLDNSDTVDAIEKQLDEAMHLALKRKMTIAIGHYRRKHLVEALAKKIPEFKANGVSFVTLPSLYPTH